MPRYVTQQLCGWGNYPRQPCRVFRPEKPADGRAIIQKGPADDFIARGLGRSYGDSAINAEQGVILTSRLNRFIDFDPATGILEAEAGVALADIIDVFLPRGFFLPVTPGTKFVTLGGAVAADVHGKNHHQAGSIGNFIVDFKLLTATGEARNCSRHENADLFRATMGGMGLTGVILSVRLRLAATDSCYVQVDYQRAANLDQALELFASGDQQYRYSVAWIDCLATGAALGRSVLMRGNTLARADLPADLADKPLELPHKHHRSVPFNMPAATLNPLTVRLFNAVFYHRHKDQRQIVDFDTFFYPLDSTLHWNRMYGKRGFIQYQPAFPPQTARQGLVELLEALTSSRRASFLAVLKSFGPVGEGLLSFPFEGQTLALDLPYTGPDLLNFTRQLDAIVLKHGGRIYLAKDACLEPATFKAMYGQVDTFQAIRRQFDPDLKFNSSQARRLGLAGTP